MMSYTDMSFRDGQYAIVEKIKEISHRYDSERCDELLQQTQQAALQTSLN